MQAVSSAGIVSIFGSAFAVAGSFRQVGPEDIVNDRLPTNLGGVCVLFGDERAFILHVLANQLNAQAPALQADQTVEVQVARNCDLPEEVRSAVQTVQVRARTPEFFYWVQNADAVNPIAAVNPVTGQFIGEPDTIGEVLLERVMIAHLIQAVHLRHNPGREHFAGGNLGRAVSAFKASGTGRATGSR